MLYILIYRRMNKYELVCVIDAGLPSTEIKSVQESVEKTVGKKSILATDQMWLLPLAYPLNGQDQGYFLSYHISLDPKELEEIKWALRLEKRVPKFVFYRMGDNEKFLTFSELEQKFETNRPQDKEQEAPIEEKPGEPEEKEEKKKEVVIEPTTEE